MVFSIPQPFRTWASRIDGIPFLTKALLHTTRCKG